MPPFLEVDFEKFFVGKLKMINWNRFEKDQNKLAIFTRWISFTGRWFFKSVARRSNVIIMITYLIMHVDGVTLKGSLHKLFEKTKDKTMLPREKCSLFIYLFVI